MSSREARPLQHKGRRARCLVNLAAERGSTPQSPTKKSNAYEYRRKN